MRTAIDNYLTLVTQSELSDELEFVVKSLLLEGTSGGRVGL